MRAALLREIIDIYKMQKTKSASGAEKKEWIKTHSIKASRKKLSASVGDGISANEEFIGNTLVFQVRKYHFLEEDMRVKYKKYFYKIILLDLQGDNTYFMTCSKINE